MTILTFIIITLFAAAAVVAWGSLRRQRRDKELVATAPLPTSLPAPVEDNSVEPPDEEIVLVAQAEVGHHPKSFVPEIQNDSGAHGSPQLQSGLPSLRNLPSEQPLEIQCSSLQSTTATVFEEPVTGAEQLSAPNFVTVESNVKQTAETSTTRVEDAPHTVVPIVMLNEMDNNSSTPSNQTDAVGSSPTDLSIIPSIEEKEPNIQALQQEAPTEVQIAPRPPTYRPTTPPARTVQPRRRRPASTRPTQDMDADLRLRVQLVFGRGGVVRSLALVPDRRDGMPTEIEVAGTQGELHLTELRDDCYEPVTLSDASNALLQGIEWRGRGDARRWRWVLGGRELYVLAPGDEFGLHGFVSTARLRLNARHVVLATKRLREEVMVALTEAECATPEVSDDTASGVPAGLLLFRDVMPTRAVPLRDERDILNSLCPAHEIEPHFVGGVRLERNTWLAGYPPRIRFTGEFANGFEVKIDGHLANRASDGAFEAPGWNSEGEHRLWFGDRAETYSLCTMEEGWSHWHAHDFGMGAAICGAGTHAIADAGWRQVCVPAANPLLLGAQPGEIVRCHIRRDSCSENILVQLPILPVWALPANPARADKRSAGLLLLNSIGPIPCADQTNRKRSVRQWAAAIGNAGRAQLALATESEEAKALWRSYRVVAKRFRRRKQ